jgi:hypothetical protein
MRLPGYSSKGVFESIRDFERERSSVTSMNPPNKVLRSLIPASVRQVRSGVGGVGYRIIALRSPYKLPVAGFFILTRALPSL